MTSESIDKDRMTDTEIIKIERHKKRNNIVGKLPADEDTSISPSDGDQKNNYSPGSIQVIKETTTTLARRDEGKHERNVVPDYIIVIEDPTDTTTDDGQK